MERKQIIKNFASPSVAYRGKPFWSPIVDPEIFAKVRANVSCNKIGKHSNAVVYLLRQKMKCGYCGENMSGECGTSKQGVRTYYYKCHGRKNLRNGCKQQPYRKEILEKFVLDSIITELKKPGQMDYIVQGLLALQESQIKANSTLSILEREQKQNESAMENIMNAVERGFYTAAANKRMKEQEDRQAELERLIIIERSKMQVKVTASEIRAYYEEALMKEPQMLINFLIREIIVFDDEIHIHFNSPLQTGPDAGQGLSVGNSQINPRLCRGRRRASATSIWTKNPPML